MRKILFSFLVSNLFWTLPSTGKELEPVKIAPEVSGLIEKYCVRCHGPKRQKGSLRLDHVSTMISDETVALQWQDILDVMNLSEMPPEDSKQPTKEELTTSLEKLTGNLVEARKRLTDSGGHIVLRRLNRREYDRTIKALFGVPVDVSLLPEDGRVENYDTLGQANSFSSLHLERYLKLGRSALDQSFAKLNKRNRETHTRKEQGESRVSKDIKGQIKHIDNKIAGFDKALAKGDKRHSGARDVKVIERKLVDWFLAQPAAKTGAVLPSQGIMPTKHVSLGWKPKTGLYKVKVRLGVAQDKAVDDLFLKVARKDPRSSIPDALDLFKVTGTLKEPQEIELFYEVDNLLSNQLVLSRWDLHPQVHPEFAKAKDYWFRFRGVRKFYKDTKPNIWIDWVEVKGPLEQKPAPLSARNLIKGDKVTKKSDTEVRSLFEQFTFKAFRNEQAPKTYIDKLMKIYKASLAHGAKTEDALKDALSVVLASPRFLFINEPGSAGEKSRSLTERELAIRLAYFLWSAPPDDMLLELAAQGKLRDKATLLSQVDRMISDSRSNHFVETFLTQWLELDRLNGIDPDSTVSKKYDRVVQDRSRKEVYAFFKNLLRQNLPATDLLSSDYVMVDSAMAKFYGFKGVSSDEFKAVKVPANSIRGGLLGQSAILTLTGTGERTSPVERGVFVLRKLLHRPPPEAPANVPMLDEKKVGTISIKETLANHMDKAQCKSCHQRIDPLGFGLENFDPVGLWRTQVDSKDGKKKFGIEPQGVMPDGTSKFNNFLEMKKQVSKHKSAMLKSLTEALMIYGLGRTIGFTDLETVDSIVKETAKDNYGMKTLLHKIISSKPFLRK